MVLTRLHPFTDDFSTGIRLFQDAVNRLFSEPAGRPCAPPVDILETENELVVKADLPDIDLKDIDIRLEDGTLTLKGERKLERDEKHTGYHRIERSYGSFMRCFGLPDRVDPDKVRAEYKDGVLTVTLPKKEIAKPKTIKVGVNSN